MDRTVNPASLVAAMLLSVCVHAQTDETPKMANYRRFQQVPAWKGTITIHFASEDTYEDKQPKSTRTKARKFDLRAGGMVGYTALHLNESACQWVGICHFVEQTNVRHEDRRVGEGSVWHNGKLEVWDNLYIQEGGSAASRPKPSNDENCRITIQCVDDAAGSGGAFTYSLSVLSGKLPLEMRRTTTLDESFSPPPTTTTTKAVGEQGFSISLGKIPLPTSEVKLAGSKEVHLLESSGANKDEYWSHWVSLPYPLEREWVRPLNPANKQKSAVVKWNLTPMPCAEAPCVAARIAKGTCEQMIKEHSANATDESWRNTLRAHLYQLTTRLSILRDQMCADERLRRKVYEMRLAVLKLDRNNVAGHRVEQAQVVAGVAIDLDAITEALGCGPPPGTPAAAPALPSPCAQLANAALDGLAEYMDRLKKVTEDETPPNSDAYDIVIGGLKGALNEAEATAKGIEGTGGTAAQQLEELKTKIAKLQLVLDAWEKMKVASCVPPQILALLQRLRSEGRLEHGGTCAELAAETADWVVKMTGMPAHRQEVFRAVFSRCP